ncbi:MAG TPA: hypothetical protein PKO33_06185, partial [Pyrinomonadaceae bacterium]|nr:hypothetical protein [Pyrinomonadaceae bacterium]
MDQQILDFGFWIRDLCECWSGETDRKLRIENRKSRGEIWEKVIKERDAERSLPDRTARAV